MTWEVTADLRRFGEAVTWFMNRVIVTRDEYDKLSTEARKHAFTVAGYEDLKAVTEVYDATLKAIDAGDGLDKFKKRIRERLGKDAYNHRTESAFVTNVQTALNAGRYEQMQDPDIAESRPFRMHDSVLDGRTTEICKERDGLVFPASAPYALTNNPPLHYHCRAGLRALTPRQARRRGITENPNPPHPPAPGFGHVPAGRVPFEPDTSGTPAEIIPLYQRKQEQLGLSI